MNKYDVEHEKWNGLVARFRCEIKSLRAIINRTGTFRYYGQYGWLESLPVNDFERMAADIAKLQPILDNIRSVFIEAEKQRSALAPLYEESKSEGEKAS